MTKRQDILPSEPVNFRPRTNAGCFRTQSLKVDAYFREVSVQSPGKGDVVSVVLSTGKALALLRPPIKNVAYKSEALGRLARTARENDHDLLWINLGELRGERKAVAKPQYGAPFQASVSLAQQFLVVLAQVAELNDASKKAMGAIVWDERGSLNEYARHVSRLVESSLASLSRVLQYEALTNKHSTTSVVGIGDYVNPHIHGVLLSSLGIGELTDTEDGRLSNAMTLLLRELYRWIGVGISRPYGRLSARVGQPIHIYPASQVLRREPEEWRTPVKRTTVHYSSL